MRFLPKILLLSFFAAITCCLHAQPAPDSGSVTYYDTARTQVHTETWYYGNSSATNTYFTSGKKQYAVTDFKNDGITMIDSAYYNNDSLNGTMKVVHYRNGMRIGSYEEYYPDGNLKVIGIYDFGERAGDWDYYTYTTTMVIVRTETYESGKVVKTKTKTSPRAK
jgi:antitoxin component YwqK of YwqJK toxin-antitoxin module